MNPPGSCVTLASATFGRAGATGSVVALWEAVWEFEAQPTRSAGASTSATITGPMSRPIVFIERFPPRIRMLSSVLPRCRRRLGRWGLIAWWRRRVGGCRRCGRGRLHRVPVHVAVDRLDEAMAHLVLRVATRHQLAKPAHTLLD